MLEVRLLSTEKIRSDLGAFVSARGVLTTSEVMQKTSISPSKYNQVVTNRLKYSFQTPPPLSLKQPALGYLKKRTCSAQAKL
eukprot:6127129-Amphidinium_carterae.1